MLEFIQNILFEAYCGNFSFAILITNILQLIVATIACVIGVKMYLIKKEERKEKKERENWGDK